MRHSRHQRILAACSIIALAAIGTTGCSGAKPTVTVTPQVTADKGAPPAPGAVSTWPLTGVRGEVAERPSVAVKIENSSEARPQTGLQAADIVYEEMVEGGIARFVAIYHSQLPTSIGPIRSIRPMDGPIVGPTKGLLVFSGGQARFQSDASAAGLQLLSDDAGAGGFTRSPDHSAPHNLFGSLDQFLAQADKDHKAAPPAQFEYADTAADASAAAGKVAEKLTTAVSQVSQAHWTWSKTDDAYLRSEGDAPLTDAATDKQLHATNVVALHVTTRAAGGTDAAGSSIPETVLIDSTGKGIVATGGKVIDVTWAKKAAGDPITLTTADGKAVQLAPGNTWVELVPDGLGAIATD